MHCDRSRFGYRRYLREGAVRTPGPKRPSGELQRRCERKRRGKQLLAVATPAAAARFAFFAQLGEHGFRHLSASRLSLPRRFKKLPSLAERTDDVSAVLDDIGSARAIVVGISEGEPLAIQLAVEQPERIAGLVLSGGFARMAVGSGYPFGWKSADVERLRGASPGAALELQDMNVGGNHKTTRSSKGAQASGGQSHARELEKQLGRRSALF